MPGDLAVGLDLGTSGLKAVVADASGRVLAHDAHPYPTSRPEPGAAEQDPQDWLIAVDAALAGLGRVVSPSRWGAIGLSGMLPTLVALEAQGGAVGPAVTWEDARADRDADRLLARHDATELYRRTGQRVDGRYLVPMFARLLRLGRRPASMLGAKDWLVRELTGSAVTDPSTAAGSGAFDLRTGEWIRDLLEDIGSPAVPDVSSSTTLLDLRPEVRNRWGVMADTALVLGAADSVLGGHGLGTRRPGDLACIAGTSTIFLGIADDPTVDDRGRYLVTPTADGWGRELDLVSTGSAMAWLAGVMGLSGPRELTELATTGRLDTAPVVLPYFGPGEQGALWDPALTGTVGGLTLGTGRAELALGLLAGIVVESVRCIDVLRELPTAADRIRVSGAASSPFLRHALADATGLAIASTPGEHDHSAVGAALLAGESALGWQEVPTEWDVDEPDARNRDIWAERAARHDAMRRELFGSTSASFS